MNVCYVTMAFPAPAETFAASDVRALLRAGSRVTVHSMRPADTNGAAMTAERGLEDVTTTHNSLRASVRGMGAAMRRPLFAARMLAWVVRYSAYQPRHLVRSLVLLPRCFDILSTIERDRPDVVHLFWGHYPAIIGHMVRTRLPGIPLTMFLGAYDLTMRYGPSRAVARHADIVWTHARENVPALARLGIPTRAIRVVYRGTEFTGISARPADKTPFRIVVVSRLIAAKAVDDALRVFARVRATWPAASLVVLGDGPERNNLVALASGLGIAHSVSFLGHVPHSAVRSAMAEAEVLVLVSRKDSERLPNVVKEAMASGCVCVVTRSPGIEELVIDGVSGAIVAPGAVEDAAQRIDGLFAQRASAREMAAAAERHVRAHFDVDRSMAIYREVWTDLLLGTRPSRSSDAARLAADRVVAGVAAPTARAPLDVPLCNKVHADHPGEVECA